jgi:hypothetical protein
MKKLNIYYGVQGNGIRFGLNIDDYSTLKQLFPDAQPAKGLFVEYDMKTNFAEYHPHLERYVFPALLGLNKEGDFKGFEQIQFIKTPEMKLTYTIELNHSSNDQKIQSLSR